MLFMSILLLHTVNGYLQSRLYKPSTPAILFQFHSSLISLSILLLVYLPPPEVLSLAMFSPISLARTHPTHPSRSIQHQPTFTRYHRFLSFTILSSSQATHPRRPPFLSNFTVPWSQHPSSFTRYHRFSSFTILSSSQPTPTPAHLIFQAQETAQC